MDGALPQAAEPSPAHSEAAALRRPATSLPTGPDGQDGQDILESRSFARLGALADVGDPGTALVAS